MEESKVKEIVKHVVAITDEDWELFKERSPGVYKFFTQNQRGCRVPHCRRGLLNPGTVPPA